MERAGRGAGCPGLVERGIPTLGICYGHQLLAHALGGEVGDNPNGREFGTVTVELTAEAADDPLLGGLPREPAGAGVPHAVGTDLAGGRAAAGARQP